MLTAFGAAEAYPANYQQFPRFINKTSAGATYRLLNPVYGPWAYACSRGWDISSTTAGAGQAVALVKGVIPDPPGVPLDKYQPPVGTLSEWINRQKAAGKAVVIDLAAASHESFCTYISAPGSLPVPSAARAVATVDCAVAAAITNANPQAFVLFESTSWTADGKLASLVPVVIVTVAALAVVGWLL